VRVTSAIRKFGKKQLITMVATALALGVQSEKTATSAFSASITSMAVETNSERNYSDGSMHQVMSSIAG
jgi:hypothetical protein